MLFSNVKVVERMRGKLQTAVIIGYIALTYCVAMVWKHYAEELEKHVDYADKREAHRKALKRSILPLESELEGED